MRDFFLPPIVLAFFMAISFLTDLVELLVRGDDTGLSIVMFGLFLLPLYIAVLVIALAEVFFLIRERNFDDFISFTLTGAS